MKKNPGSHHYCCPTPLVVVLPFIILPTAYQTLGRNSYFMWCGQLTKISTLPHYLLNELCEYATKRYFAVEPGTLGIIISLYPHGGLYWFHSIRPSVRLLPVQTCIIWWVVHTERCQSHIPCLLCSAYSYGWIHFIFIHLIQQLQKVCCV